MRNRALTSAAVVGLALLALLTLPALPASAKALSNSQIQKLENKLNQGKKVTYSATYQSSDGSTVTIAQQSGKSNFSTSDGSAIIDTGKKTYYCSKNAGNSGTTGNTGNSGNSGNTGSTTTTTTTKAGSLQCVNETGANPLAGIAGLFSPAVLQGLLNEVKAKAAARALGIKLTTSTETFAGQSATCVSGTVQGKTGKYCVTGQGLLAYVGGTGGSTFKMIKYSSKPAASLFQLPANATTVTIPSVP